MARFFMGLGLVLLAAIVALIGWPLTPVVQDAATAGKANTYLDENAVAVDLDADGAEFPLPDGLATAQFIMLAEIHGYAMPQAIDLMMVKKLAAERGMRAYLAELSPDQAIAFNAMVLDGDDTAARAVFDAWGERSAQWGNKEFFAKLEAITAFNAQRPDDQKIVFIGTDKPTDLEFAEQMLGQLDPSVDANFSSLANVRAINGLLLDEAMTRPDNASRYSHIVPGMAMVADLPGAEDEVFYALWGLFHGSKVLVNGAKPLAHRLIENGTFAGVGTISTLCLENCFNLLPAYGLPVEQLRGPDGEEYTLLPMSYENPYFVRIRGASELRTVMDARSSDSVFVPLTEEGSPYLEGARLSVTTGYLDLLIPTFDYEGAAGEASDAVFVMRNVPGLTPWSGSAFDISGQALAN
ncbi:MAG: hypothetical protein AAGH41_03605 [Pseudomonadota bacterium]